MPTDAIDAGSGTSASNPLAAAKASNAATSPADTAAPLSLWLKFAAKSVKSAAFTSPS
jgi:hypothetical protein